MLDSDVSFINQQFFASSVTPRQIDTLLEQGWRHFGIHFFRYSYGFYELDVRRVIPLRVSLNKFSLSKSQRRTLKKNLDLRTVVRPIEITDPKFLAGVMGQPAAVRPGAGDTVENLQVIG